MMSECHSVIYADALAKCQQALGFTLRISRANQGQPVKNAELFGQLGIAPVTLNTNAREETNK